MTAVDHIKAVSTSLRQQERRCARLAKQLDRAKEQIKKLKAKSKPTASLKEKDKEMIRKGRKSAVLITRINRALAKFQMIRPAGMKVIKGGQQKKAA